MANKPKTNNNEPGRDIMLTPPHALKPIIPLLKNYPTVWESAYHPKSLLAKTLESAGFNVIKTGLPDHDYFDHSKTPKNYDVQVTNVPFSLKYKWIEHAFILDKPFALLVPYETTASGTFNNLLKEYYIYAGDLAVLNPTRRINFKTPQYGWGVKVWDEVKGKDIMRGNSAQMPTMWLTYKLQPEMAYIPQFTTYYAPIDNVRYDEDDNEI